jgi:ribonuclease-3
MVGNKVITEKKNKKPGETDLSALQKTLGHRFKNEQYLRTALTHASAIPDRGNLDPAHHHYYYEQLEFLGDRVLSLVVAHLIYDIFPGESEGDWAKRHAEAVRETTLARISAKLELGGEMFLSTSEQRSGGRKKKAMLADVLEAVIAALYLDGGYNVARKFIEREWRDSVAGAPRPPEDPKTRLQEWSQGRGQGLPVYELVSRSGPDHAPEFMVSVTIDGFDTVTVSGESKRKAEKKAAELMMRQIEEREKRSKKKPEAGDKKDV